jgi:hypothetical protein
VGFISKPGRGRSFVRKGRHSIVVRLAQLSTKSPKRPNAPKVRHRLDAARYSPPQCAVGVSIALRDLKTSPPFITNSTFSRTRISASGSPRTRRSLQREQRGSNACYETPYEVLRSYLSSAVRTYRRRSGALDVTIHIEPPSTLQDEAAAFMQASG